MLAPMPDEVTLEVGFAAELELSLTTSERAWRPGEAGEWDPAKACPERPFFFLTGPFCAFDESAWSGDARGDGAWLHRYMSQGVPGIDYPPLGHILSCPGCGVSTRTLPAAFLSLQYAKFVLKEPSHAGAVCTNKVLPRCWCLRCLADVVTPLAAPAAANSQPPQGGLWPHLRRLPHQLPSLMTATCYKQHKGRALSSFMDGRFVELDGPGVPPHCMDHIYYAMSLRSQRRMGGHLVPSQGPINHDGSSLINTVLVGSTGCHACGLRFGQIARKRCPCGLVAYCSASCQRTDWSAHKVAHRLAVGL